MVTISKDLMMLSLRQCCVASDSSWISSDLIFGTLIIPVWCSMFLVLVQIPLLGWLILILVVAWRDPSGQWTSIGLCSFHLHGMTIVSVDKPAFTMRTEPRELMIKNVLNIVLIFVDFLQLTSLHFLQEAKPEQAVDSSGTLSLIGPSFVDSFICHRQAPSPLYLAPFCSILVCRLTK